MAQVIRNPNDPDHVMAVETVPSRMRVTRGGMVLCDSLDILRVLEQSARGKADPVHYFARTDLALPLGRVDNKVTHCPLKGDATYYELGDEIVAWSYEHPLDFADVIKGRIAFYADKVEIGTVD